MIRIASVLPFTPPSPVREVKSHSFCQMNPQPHAVSVSAGLFKPRPGNPTCLRVLFGLRSVQHSVVGSNQGYECDRLEPRICFMQWSRGSRPHRVHEPVDPGEGDGGDSIEPAGPPPGTQRLHRAASLVPPGRRDTPLRTPRNPPTGSLHPSPDAIVAPVHAAGPLLPFTAGSPFSAGRGRLETPIRSAAHQKRFGDDVYTHAMTLGESM